MGAGVGAAWLVAVEVGAAVVAVVAVVDEEVVVATVAVAESPTSPSSLSSSSSRSVLRCSGRDRRVPYEGSSDSTAERSIVQQPT